MINPLNGAEDTDKMLLNVQFPNVNVFLIFN